MKKLIFISLFAAAAASAFTACSEVGTTSDTGSVQESASDAADSALTSEDTETEDEEMPTDRVPDIQTADDFEYEIIDGAATITKYTGEDSQVEVPSEIGGAPVAKIGTYAFEAEYDVTSVTLPDTITLIAEGAFMDCSSLESINIPEGVGGIDRSAFAACTSLTSMVLPAAVQYVREEAFTACEAMTSLTIENPDLAYENWGLEELPDLVIYAPEGSAAASWAESLGKLGY